MCGLAVRDKESAFTNLCPVVCSSLTLKKRLLHGLVYRFCQAFVFRCIRYEINENDTPKPYQWESRSNSRIRF